MLGFLIGAALTVAVGAVSGIIKGNAKNEQDKQERETINTQKTIEQKGNTMNALNEASANTLGQATITESLEDEVSMYNAQVEQMAMNYAQATGSAVANSAQTGFRNNGANTNVQQIQQDAGKFNTGYLATQLNQQNVSQGLNRMANQSSTSNALAGYRENISAFNTQADLKIKQLGIAENYWWSDRMWSDFGMGALDSGLSYIGANTDRISNEVASWFVKD